MSPQQPMGLPKNDEVYEYEEETVNTDLLQQEAQNQPPNELMVAVAAPAMTSLEQAVAAGAAQAEKASPTGT